MSTTIAKYHIIQDIIAITTCIIFQFQPYNNLTKKKLSPWILWVKPKDIFVHMQQRSVSLSHTKNARIHFIQTKQKQKQTDAPSKVHKMWWNKNIVSGEEPDNVVDEEGDALGIPKLRRLSLLEICRGEPPGHPQA